MEVTTNLDTEWIAKAPGYQWSPEQLGPWIHLHCSISFQPSLLLIEHYVCSLVLQTEICCTSAPLPTPLMHAGKYLRKDLTDARRVSLLP